jgi:NADH:ubiquinone oxidoreductase subunit 6 (subunit J)
MLTKGLLSKTETMNKNNQKLLSLVKVIFYLGALLLIVSFGYMIANFERADKIVSIWVPFVLAGAAMIVLSQVIKLLYLSKETTKRKLFKS